MVKSVDAFIAAQQSNPVARASRTARHTLEKEMSAESAVELLLNPKSRSNLIIAEGKRNVDVYKMIDKQLGVDEGTTAGVAKTEWKTSRPARLGDEPQEREGSAGRIPLPVQLFGG